MTKMLSDGYDQLLWIPEGGLANLAAPTVGELTDEAVINLSCLVSKDGFNFGATGSTEVNDPPLCATGQFTAPGMAQYNDDMNFYRFTETLEDVPWSTFDGANIPGILAYRVGHLSDVAPAVGHEYEIHEVVTDVQRFIAASGDGGWKKFGQKFHPQAVEPRAVVVADS